MVIVYDDVDNTRNNMKQSGLLTKVKPFLPSHSRQCTTERGSLCARCNRYLHSRSLAVGVFTLISRPSATGEEYAI
jgi:hypothetical protein